ncbi:MAG: DUF3320 domain-containing protein [Oscillospiraceae bacterium]|nr:DUF3320 domain-containing protein [Oscillospiraceae bacterium]
MTPESENAAASAPVKLEYNVLPVINYALQHNGIPAVRSVTLTNTTAVDLEDLELTISAVPEFVLEFTSHIDCLPAGRAMTLTGPALLLSGEFLAGLTEKVTGLLRFEVRRGKAVLACAHAETTVLAYDQWHGLGFYPELLAAFVTPNHPALPPIIRRAAEFLGQWTGDPSMDAYQSRNPNRVVSQAAAIFSALQEQAIAYAVPPASFGQTGQRVRLCDAVLQQKLGTCLDLTLLYAACLEAVGLHPLLITTEGHIFAGVWLEERMFPECVQDDAALITKRLASGVHEIAVAETTCMTAGKDAAFDDARAIGERSLATRGVEYIIDVRRARLSGISPLPQRVASAGGWQIAAEVKAGAQTLAAPRDLRETIRIDPDTPDDNIPKKVQWERKLLDLGMRNTLINLRLTRTQLPILTDSLDQLENALAVGGDFTIRPRPADWQAGEVTFENLRELGAAPVIRAEFENKRLRTVLTEAELSKTLKDLYRTARTALEENGANTLYLAMGLLRWYESTRSTKPRYAPIILLPIEIIRRSAAQGYVIRLRDDDPQMNITLLEKLKQDFGIQVSGLDPLPLDDHGVDIRRVLTIMRKAVMDQPRWDVLETAGIGIFSFSQFVMWNDIRSRTDDLLHNKIVRSLMEGKLAWDARPLQMGQRVEEDGVLLPMSADASQLYAIQTACAGESFVLHGPPGTGKSQTITSLIANALAQGKRVLFVAEKMAALEVVQKRLDSIGIGPFCLELHSNKSKKKAVLEQLRQASEVTKTVSAQDYAARADRIAQARAGLDVYARQLHQPLNCGGDLYALINEYETCKHAPELVPFSREFIRSLDAAAIENHQLAVERLAAAGREAGHPRGHPLADVGCTRYTQSLRNGLPDAVARCRTELKRVQAWTDVLIPALREQPITCAEDVQRLARTADALSVWYAMPPAWAKAPSPQFYFGEAGRMAAHYEKAAALEAGLLEIFRPEFLDQDGQALWDEYNALSEKWFLPKLLGMNKLAGRVNAFAKMPVDTNALADHLAALRSYQAQTAAGDQLRSQYGRDLGHFYDGKNTEWASIARLAEQAGASARTLWEIYGTDEFLHTHGGDPVIREAVAGLSADFAAFTQAKQNFDQLLTIRQRTEENWLSGQIALCDAVEANADGLKEWISYVSTARELEEMGLANVVAGYESGICADDPLTAWRKALLQGLICDAIDDSTALNAFSGPVFNRKIEQYRRMDREWTELSRQEIYCRLAAKVPDFTREAAQSSELGILQRCIRSGGWGVSIRRLFDQIPNLLPRLCPCMLMSPISAAQYLDPGREPFDIVVFDEASQLPTCKAVGVLARGRDAVIVGDPKQMPPTSFFAANTVDEDNLDIEDLESILDDCLALNMPQSHLLWHYRSRHESLIAFSNTRFYQGRLYTFPSVNDRESRVRLAPVEGVFERGRGRRNMAEAKAVVAELQRRCADPALSKQSVGVVTFNIQQQHLIDDLLSDACAADPALEKWAFGSPEPVFIKNLENVQGDERDVVLFSIGYGPDENGKVSMNFGPLNREGGWRRLNVAVSRARCEMVVFSTLRPDQIDLNRTKAEGVAALRGFLEYAQGREMAMDAAGGYRPGKAGIAAAIASALKEQGFDSDLNVGRSAYRIDIGVADPDKPDRYILGIMLDGDSYGGARTTRDREIGQIGVLKGLGWNILRVWSMDWWDNSAKELKRITARLEELRRGIHETVETPPQMPRTLAANVPVQKKFTLPVYQAAVLAGDSLCAEEFTDSRYVAMLKKKIRAVIDAEAPVSAGLLTRRVVQSCGITRAGSRIQAHMNAILGKMNLPVTPQGDALFYWRSDQDPDSYAIFRTAGEGESRRDIRDVSRQEAANAVCAVLHEQVGMGMEDLLRETGRKLGYTRLGGNVQSALEAGVAHALARGFIAWDSDTCVLTPAGTQRAEETIAQSE